MKVDSSTAVAETAMRRPAASPATGPPIDRASQPRDATASDPRRGRSRRRPRRRIAAGSGRGRREQVVVERAVVEVADRRRRSEQRARSRRWTKARRTSMSWPWSASQVPRVGRSTKRRMAASDEQSPIEGERPGARSSRPRALGRRCRRSGRRPAVGPPARLARVRRARPGSTPRVSAPGGSVGERLAGGDRIGPGDVDRVVALVHPGRLEVVGRAGEARDGGGAWPSPLGPDPARPEMLVAVEMRAALGSSSR